MSLRRRSQPRLRGVKRQPVSASLLAKIDSAVEADARRFRVSASFVIATVLAFHYDIDEQPDFRETSKS